MPSVCSHSTSSSFLSCQMTLSPPSFFTVFSLWFITLYLIILPPPSFKYILKISTKYVSLNYFLVYLTFVPFSLCGICLFVSCCTLYCHIPVDTLHRFSQTYNFNSQHIKRQCSYPVFPWYFDSPWRFNFTAHCNIFPFPFTSVNADSIIFLYQFSILSCKFCGNFLPNDGLEVINPSHFLAQLSLLWLKPGVGLRKPEVFEKGDFCHESSNSCGGDHVSVKTSFMFSLRVFCVFS